MEGLKIVTIGGGSSYTPELIEGFIKRFDELPVRELWLVDIEEGKEKLEIVGNLARRMVKKANVPIDIHLTLDRRAALIEADFVTTQFRVGFLEARGRDERIPLKYNVIGQETNGPGGLLKALRTVPVILDILHDMEELCPAAWLVNFTNPSGIVTEAVNKCSNWKQYVGLCNVPINLQYGFARMFGVGPNDVRIDYAGLNHMIFGLKVFVNGVDCTEQAIEYLIHPVGDFSMKNIPAIPWDEDFIKALGAIPCPYLQYYYNTSDILQKELDEFKANGIRAEVVKKLEAELFEKYRDVNLNVKPPELEKRGGAYYSDAACSLINSIYNDRRDIQYVNTINRGAVPFLPDDCIVEVSSMITKNGPVPLTVGNPPFACQGLIYSIKAFEIAAVDAAVSGDYGKALLAMGINPLVPSLDVARKMLDEMLEANKEYLPRFFNK